ncbi:MAG: MarR family transcriptional regulator [Candidatus Aenigmarchaeota archaeon]|nr:MarR family transcriptional regulator [Candidatus Aenigmarchaeota archaeon]
MKNMTQRKQYGIILVAISVFLFFVITAFTLHIVQLNQYLHQDCDLPANICPFNTSMPAESIIGYVIDVSLGIFGIYLFLTGAKPEPKRQPETRSLEPDEKKLLEMVSSQGAIFQSELVEKSGMNKVKVTRILDRLEAKGFVERKRRGMTNVVMLRNKE